MTEGSPHLEEPPVADAAEHKSDAERSRYTAWLAHMEGDKKLLTVIDEVEEGGVKYGLLSTPTSGGDIKIPMEKLKPFALPLNPEEAKPPAEDAESSAGEAEGEGGEVSIDIRGDDDAPEPERPAEDGEDEDHEELMSLEEKKDKLQHDLKQYLDSQIRRAQSSVKRAKGEGVRVRVQNRLNRLEAIQEAVEKGTLRGHVTYEHVDEEGNVNEVTGGIAMLLSDDRTVHENIAKRYDREGKTEGRDREQALIDEIDGLRALFSETKKSWPAAEPTSEPEPREPGDPADEETPPEDEEDDAKEEIRNLKEEMQRLRDEVERQRREFEDRIRAKEEEVRDLTARLTAMESENEDLRKKNEELEDELAAARAAVPPPTPPPTISPAEVYKNKDGRLKTVRKNLIEVTLRRKGRMTDSEKLGKRRGEDLEEYKSLAQEYIKALTEAAVALKEKLEDEGKTEKQIRSSVKTYLARQQRQFAQEEVKTNEKLLDEAIKNGNFIQKGYRKVLRAWAKLPTWGKLGIGVAVGVGGGFAAAGLGAGLAGVAAASAAKFSLGLMNRKANIMNTPKHQAERYKAGSKLDKEFQDMVAKILGDDPDELESRIREVAERSSKDLDERVRSAQRRNKLGNALLGISGVAMSVGVAEMAGVVPNETILHGIHSIFGNHHAAGAHGRGAGVGAPGRSTGGNIPPSLMNLSHFKPDSFYGKTPHQAVANMFHQVIEKNGYQVHGLTADKIDAITKDMMQHHWHIASGRGPGEHQNIVDVARDWANGHTQNWDASAQQGLETTNGSVHGDSVGQWRRFMEVAYRHGVTFSRASAATRIPSPKPLVAGAMPF